MKVAAWMFSPVRWTISAIGRMSFSWVRAAQLARIFSLLRTISWASASQSARARSRPRQPKVERVDAQGFHQMQDLNFLRNRGIAHRRRLQAIAQGLIVE